MSNNGIKKYLKSFYKYVDSFNATQAGFVGLAESYSGLLSHVNQEKTDDLKQRQDAVNAQIDVVKGFDINDKSQADARADAEKELTKLQNELKQSELEWERTIQSLTPIVSSIQQEVKTLSSGASLLPQIGESALSMLSKVVELGSSIRV